jgi:alpha-L-fucosidase 2
MRQLPRAFSNIRWTILLAVFFASGAWGQRVPGVSARHDLIFPHLARSWDEAIPLGNGMIGALVWQRDKTLRMSLDRADLWDLREIKEFKRPEFRFSWVVEQATKGDYRLVQELGDVPYDRDAAPTKLPGAALELDIPDIDEVEAVQLRLEDALCTVRWRSGVRLQTYVHATEERGWFQITGMRKEIKPRLIPPPYSSPDTATAAGNSGPGGNDLRRLGYSAPELTESKNVIVYRQQCYGEFSYSVHVSWSVDQDNTLTGSWEIHPSQSYSLQKREKPTGVVRFTEKLSFEKDLRTHAEWWKRFWARSSIQLPDSILETQWYRELYKFGSASRRGAPPITLQAVWTADNSRLPPWKGDFHHDLNTQLSYWPSYSSNHLEEELAFLEWLWWCRPVAERYTKTYFGTSGLNFAGVSTLTGEPMGGWIQYSLSPTVSAWLSHHFYLHWRYSLDRTFLRERAYPWIRAVAVHLDEISVRDSLGRRKLPLSSSPEIHDNRVEAWFRETTNYDIALIRWLFGAAAELAGEAGFKEEAARWSRIKSEWPDLAIAPGNGKLLVAPGEELKESHRHFSHLMAIHPLGLLDWNRGEPDKKIIDASLTDLERLGPDWWCGYSYAWLGSMWARAQNGEKAAEALKIFSTCFCLPNSFHVNGDQSGTGKSKFTYRPFTLEGNFACAAGIQEMLLQSHNGVLRVFPAIPSGWEDVSFTTLRAEGATLVSAERRNGRTQAVKITCEKGGPVKLADPFGGAKFTQKKNNIANIRFKSGFIEFLANPGAVLELSLDKSCN